MGITLNRTELSTCEATTGWADDGSGNVSALATTTTASRQGTNRLEWGVATASVGVLKFTFQGGTTIDVTQNEIGCWFLLPKGNAAGETPVLANSGGDALRIRLYEGTNTADWYIGDDSTLPGGWQYIRVSGNNPDNVPGTTPDYTSIDGFGIYTNNTNENNNAKGDAYYGVDYLVAYDKIEVTGYNTAIAADEPWSMDSIYDLCVTTKDDANNLKTPDDCIWGQFQQEDIFYRIFGSMYFGDGTAGEFKTTNRYLYFKPVSDDVTYDVNVSASFPVTFGDKDEGDDETYALNGCQIINEVVGSARGSINIDPTAEFNLYACRIEGWDTINLGTNQGTGPIELIKSDFFNNNSIELRSTGLSAQDVRMHFSDGAQAEIGTVYDTPNSMNKIQIFLVTDGLTFKIATTVDEYFAGDTTYDLVVLDGITVDLLNSTFSENKIKRVTT